MKSHLKTATLAGLALIASIATGCGGDSGSSQGASLERVTGAQDLIGMFKGGCETYSTEKSDPVWGAVSGASTLSFSEAQLTITGAMYKEGDCAGAATSTITTNADYRVVGASNLGSSILDVDGTFISVSQVFHDETSASFMNTISYCGFNDWTAGVSKVITGRPCLGDQANGRTLFTIFKVTETELQLGDADEAHDGLTAERRHVILGETIFKRN